MNPAQFIAKWSNSTLKESAGAQQHFLDLCELIGHPKPADIDATGESFCFERGAAKKGGGDGWADVWKRGYFGWEYKGKHKDLDKAYLQLQDYRADLENPPLLVVSDMDRIVIHTNFTATAVEHFTIPLEQLGSERNLEILRFLFHDPDKLRPVVTSPVITEEAADKLGRLAQTLRESGEDPERIAPFLDRLIFCLFVEDIFILPVRQGPNTSPPLLTQLLRNFHDKPEIFGKQLQLLFQTMATGGYFGADEVLHFNGDLFTDSTVLPLTSEALGQLLAAAKLDWAKVEPSIFGTLFERGLDPAKRAQLGAHYTSRDDIETLIEPVLMAPLKREWQTIQQAIQDRLASLPPEPPAHAAPKTKSTYTRQANQAAKEFALQVSAFKRKLRATTVLDPACGSGNFLYVALRQLKDLERDVIEYCYRHNVPTDGLPLVGPHQMFGIEINTYAYHLAQLVVWIGHLQWMHAYGYGISEPVLQPLKQNFQNKDAILDLTDPEHPKEPTWPKVDVIVGNPPFLGDKLMRGELGDTYVEQVRSLYSGRVPGGADLCCYWFERARAYIESSQCKRAGLLATQGIRGGANRKVLERIKDTGDIFFAVSDRSWMLDGANVHVSMVGFDNRTDLTHMLDGKEVTEIAANLSSGPAIGTANRIRSNRAFSFIGASMHGPFSIGEERAFEMLRSPSVGGRPSSDVIRTWCNGTSLTNRLPHQWIIDVPPDVSVEAASLYDAPFAYLKQEVYPIRQHNRREMRRKNWWLLGDPQKSMRAASEPLDKYIGTPRVAKHRIFLFIGRDVLPTDQVVVFARSDNYFFGILHSRIHELWARAQGTQLRERESGFRYTPTSCFETFPFPWPPGEEPTDDPKVQAIGSAAADLNQLRENWLNPAEWVKEEILQFPGSLDGPWSRYVQDANDRGIGTVHYPRLVPKDEAAAAKLKKRTLTNLYNARPTWLDLAHKKLDEAVAEAYGLDAGLTDEEILEELLRRNLGVMKTTAQTIHKEPS